MNDYGILVGTDHTITGTGSSITGGADNHAEAEYSHIGGGASNFAHGVRSVVGGGEGNETSAFAVVAGGSSHQSLSSYASVGGGYGNVVNRDYGTVSGGRLNSSGYECFVGGGVGNHCAGYENAIVGSDSKRIDGGLISVISGGSSNVIDSILSGTIAGGQINHVSANYGTVSGGFFNRASGQGATVSGGMNNSASGDRSFVAGGGNNEAAHNFCFDGRNNSHAIHSGAFVWGDGWRTNLTSSANDQFSVRASGGYRLYSNNNHSSGVTMSAGGNAWVVVSDSTKKRDIQLSDTKAILDKLAALPIKSWEYKSEADGTEHMGPMAQDFWNAFHLGSDSLAVETIDADGVLFASVKELARQNAQKDTKISDLEARVKLTEAAILQFGSFSKSEKQ